MTDGWEDRADAWIAWARTPGFDAYWRYRGAYLDLLPTPRDGAAALDLGCGEGRTTRDLIAAGFADVTAVDASPTLLDAARTHEDAGAARYLAADAQALPFDDATFDLVSAYNVLMDVDDMAAAVNEVARVLKPGGHFTACVTHPLPDAVHRNDDGTLKLRAPYLESTTFDVTMTRGEHTMNFSGTRHPLSAYTRALEDAGLTIEALREPKPATSPEDDPEYALWHTVPMFLMWRASRV